MPSGVSSLKAGACAPPSKWPMNSRSWPATDSCQEMYGMWPENVMSGRVESLIVLEIGAPALKTSKWSPPTSRDTKIAWLPLPCVSDHTTHGTVGEPAARLPVATRGSSASLVGALLSEHAASAVALSAHGPNLCVAPDTSSGL